MEPLFQETRLRHNNRSAQSLRPIQIVRQYTKYAQGSVLISYGETRVLCTATIEESVPRFLKDSGQGWITAEYSLLPSATHTRSQREVTKGKPSGRTNEIQRLIGRSLRSVIDMSKLGERTLYIDTDVIQADGGTRTAAITGGMVALYDAVQVLMKRGVIKHNPIKEWLAAVSVGVVEGEIRCDLDYEEDSTAEVDMNVVMTESGRFVEVQGTAEKHPFARKELDGMLATAEGAIRELFVLTKDSVQA